MGDWRFFVCLLERVEEFKGYSVRRLKGLGFGVFEVGVAVLKASFTIVERILFLFTLV